MQIKQDLTDWKSTKDNAITQIKSLQLQLIVAEFMLEAAEENIKELENDEKA